MVSNILYNYQICRLCEGVGIATCNFAEYKGAILGMRYAAEKGFTNIRVKGDSKLVCMQVLFLASLLRKTYPF